MSDKFKTEMCSIETLGDRRFIIPPYQRPYVWGDEQINKLLSDFHNGRNKDYYYIGSVLISEQKENSKTIYKVIDGQQRFTTLWLIAASFKILNSQKEESDIIKFLKINDELRIDFAIRKQIKSYMLSLLDRRIGEKNQYSDEDIEKDEYLTNIAKAVTTIIGKLNTFEDLNTLGNFIYSKVRFVVNTVPENTDLNKLFATINNSGIQLEQSDILKSLLLGEIVTEKPLYSRIWETCENMNNYFERNIKQSFPQHYDWAEVQYDDLRNIPVAVESFGEKNDDVTYSITDIIEKDIVSNRIFNIEEESITTLEKLDLSDINEISGKFCGEWIGDIESESCYINKKQIKEGIMLVQFQVFNDHYAKGVELEFRQNDNNIESRIVWAKGSRRRSDDNKLILGLDWDADDEAVESLDFSIPVGRKGYGISQITINPTPTYHKYGVLSKSNDDKNTEYCRSIISFSQLLLHTYRIFRHENQKNMGDFKESFHSNKLIEIFKDLIIEDEQTIKDFFKCLWEVRFVFDKEVVKWVSEENKEEILSLSSVSKQENTFSRTVKEKDEIMMLQSVLYYTGNYNTQIWLTPYMKRLMIDKDDSLSCLEDIDNKLSLSLLTEKEISFGLMDKQYCLHKDKTFDVIDYLKENRGTSFRHYWFQKLEYILWKEFSKDSIEKEKEKFKRYRITSKNSVEHVYPQNPECSEKLEIEVLNSFGNLALLNVSQNSSYSNQSIIKKKDDFYNNKNKSTYDSLKLKLMYDKVDLTKKELEDHKKEIEKHKNEMIEKFKKHYSIT